MLKFSIYSGVWILTILLFATSVTKSKKYNTVSSVSLCHYHRNHCYQHYRGQPKNVTYLSLSFPCIVQNFTNYFINDTFVEWFESNESKDTVEEKLTEPLLPESNVKPISVHSNDAPTQDFIEHALYYHDYSRRDETKSIVTPVFLKRTNRNSWRRRTLCSVFDDGNYFAEASLDNDIVEKGNTGERKTLLDYDGSVFMNDVDDTDSLKAHVRVKRSGSESNPHMPLTYRQAYLKDLADSFSQNSYESMDGSSYDDDVSFDAKREVKSEPFANEEHPVEYIERKREGENDRSAKNDLSKTKVYSYEEVPSEGNVGIAYLGEDAGSADKIRNQDILSKESPKEIVSVTNQRTQEVSSPLEDPMLAVELVRKKRDDYAKAWSRYNLEGSRDDSIPSGISQKTILDSNDKRVELFKEDKRSVDAEKSKRDSSSENRSQRPSSLVIASLKADLLRLKRKAKIDREKSLKAKKKRKHVEKKHDTSNSNSVKTARSKGMIRSNGVRGEGKSKVGIARVVSKRNNENNFRRRSVKAEKSIDSTDSENDRSLTHTRSNKISEINDLDRFEPSLAAQVGSDVSQLKVESNENQRTFSNSEISLKEGSKLRAKRDENAETNHGFLNKEDELKYYENIRESEPSVLTQCGNRSEDRQSREDEVESGRAARSIEEVKELAKKLVTKVNELENYLNVVEVKKNVGEEKRVETRAIDDLCSNVTTACAVLKESPKIVQRCVPLKTTMQEPTSSTRIVVEREIGLGESIDENRNVKKEREKSREKKRSTRDRVARTSSSTSRTVRRENGRPKRKWGRWTDWSSCSVTCGKGRQIRWRYCLSDCSNAETEMEEKACQLPACPPGKFLGIF